MNFQLDLGAPRLRPETTPVLKGKFITKFNKKYPEHGGITNTLFNTIVKTFNNLMVDGIVDNRDGIELPEGLGYLMIITCPKAKKLNVDYKASREAGQVIMHQNWETDNKLMKIVYNNEAVKYRFSNKQVWTLSLIRRHTRSISPRYVKQWQMYHFIENGRFIGERFKKGLRKANLKTQVPRSPEGYDEFKMD